MVDTLLHIHN